MTAAVIPATLVAMVTVLVIARDLIIVTVALVFHLALGLKRFPPTLISKVNTALQITAVIVVLASGLLDGLRMPALWCTWAVAALTIASGISYIVLGVRMAEQDEAPLEAAER